MAESKPLTGKTAIVTGSGRGLGRAMALALVRAGARVTFTDIDRAVLNAAVKEAIAIGGPGSAQGIVADVSKPADAQKLVRATVAKFGRLNILVNNAGVGPQEVHKMVMVKKPKFWEIGTNVWFKTVAVNASGPYLMACAAIPAMRKARWGRIIGVTTSLDTMILPGLAAYGPSKAAHEALMFIVANDVAGTGITANVLVPGGPVNTRMIPNVIGWQNRTALIQPDVMVEPLLWLCSKSADKVNGQRFRAVAWRAERSTDQNRKEAGAPIAWAQLGTQAVYPD